MENFMKNILSETVTEVSEGAVGWGIEEVEATKKAKPGIITQS